MVITAQKFTAVVALAALLVTGLFVSATPASAFWFGGSDDVNVSNKNSAFVVNNTSASASTGGNYAGGSTGGDGGNGGDIENEGGDQDVEGADTGNGGNGGAGGEGGTVYSGDATAGAVTENDINSNKTKVNLCGCDEESDGGDVEVRNRNKAVVFNSTEAEAKTGRNTAKGSRGGDAGNGGDIENDGGHHDDQEVDDATTGNGGNGGAGGAGGLVDSGAAVSGAATLNVVNRNVTRIRR